MTEGEVEQAIETIMREMRRQRQGQLLLTVYITVVLLFTTIIFWFTIHVACLTLDRLPPDYANTVDR